MMATKTLHYKTSAQKLDRSLWCVKVAVMSYGLNQGAMGVRVAPISCAAHGQKKK
jgi:hypothetical protein